MKTEKSLFGPEDFLGLVIIAFILVLFACSVRGQDDGSTGAVSGVLASFDAKSQLYVTPSTDGRAIQFAPKPDISFWNGSEQYVRICDWSVNGTTLTPEKIRIFLKLEPQVSKTDQGWLITFAPHPAAQPEGKK